MIGIGIDKKNILWIAEKRDGSVGIKIGGANPFVFLTCSVSPVTKLKELNYLRKTDRF